MKYNFTFSLALFLCFSFTLLAQDKEYTITASVKKYSTPYIAYLQYHGLNGEVKDSVEVKDGSFTFSGKIDEPRPASILLREPGKKASPQDLIKFYIEPGVLTLTGKSMIMNAGITGSTTMKDKMELDRLFASTHYDQPVRVTQETRMVAVPAGSGPPSNMGSSVGRRSAPSTGALSRRVITDVNELPYEVQSRIAAMQEDAKGKVLQFIKDHPQSFVSLHTLNSLWTAKKITYAEYLSSINVLSPVLVNSNQGKEMLVR